jgi:radical SAM protein with 4Fe4S-binding SPASM domain
MVPKQGVLTRGFPLSEPVNIPRRLAEYKRGDRTLFVAITKASSVVVGPIGADFIYMFEDGLPLGTAISNMREKYGEPKESEIHAALTNLLMQIETRAFYQDAEPKDATFEHTMLIRLTNRCNLRCTHCLVSSAPDWPIDHDLSTSEWCSAVDQFAEFCANRGITKPRVTVTGGEALVRKDALDIAKRAKVSGAYTELFSNGVLIVNSRIALAVADAVNEVQISFDGATANVHDAVRGKGMFERTVRGVRLLADAGVKFHIAIVVMPQNFDDLMDNLSSLVRMLGEGFAVKLGVAVKEGRAADNMVYASPAVGEERIQRLIDRMVAEGVRAPKPLKRNLRSVSCGYAHEITVNSDGLVYGCGPQKFPIGNLKTEPFFSIANRVMSNSKRAEIDLVEGCRDCNIRYLCGGTCRLNNISQMGRADLSCCDLAEKERNLALLFGRASNIVPIEVLMAGGNQQDVRQTTVLS